MNSVQFDYLPGRFTIDPYEIINGTYVGVCADISLFYYSENKDLLDFATVNRFLYSRTCFVKIVKDHM